MKLIKNIEIEIGKTQVFAGLILVGALLIPTAISIIRRKVL